MVRVPFAHGSAMVPDGRGRTGMRSIQEIARMFSVAAGIAMITAGVWCGMFVAPRHGSLFFLFVITIFVTGWMMIAFCDVIVLTLSGFAGAGK
jgi:hypothetical protein